jgi:hypothetical protein
MKKTILKFLIYLYSSVLTDKSKSTGLDKLFILSLLYLHLAVVNMCFIGTNNSFSNKDPLFK